MKTHKIKYGGEFTIMGWDDEVRTYCGITNCSEDLSERLVRRHDQCTCRRCQIAYESELSRFIKHEIL